MRYTNLSESQYDRLPKYAQKAFGTLLEQLIAEVRRREAQLEELRREYDNQM
jgi:hypothetical protein